jgi:eukaryotic-like serine/threonine-protein kinase
VPLTSFVGRQAELRTVIDRLRAAEQGQGGLLLLAGEPGIGKTRLGEELATAARANDDRVLWGRCWEGQGAPAFWPWVQIMRSYAGTRPRETLLAEIGPAASVIGQLLEVVSPELSNLPSPPALEPSQARFRLFDALTTFLKTAARRQPLVLILDDLHAADTPSLLLLQFLTREIRDACLLVVGSYRDVEVGRHHPLARTMSELAAEPHVSRVMLHGLGEQDVGRYGLHRRCGHTCAPRHNHL